MNLSPIYTPSPPWLWLSVLSAEDAVLLASFRYKKEGRAPVIRVLRGAKMKNVAALMDEFGAVLQFFDGFGENWPALNECLSYMDEWLEGDCYILVITKPHLLLCDEPEQLGTFLSNLEAVGEWWSKPITDNGRFNRGAVPFHVVLDCRKEDEAETRRRFPGAALLCA